MLKERYFSAVDRESKALAMRREFESLHDRRSIRLLPDRSALLVLDMQGYFLNPASHAWIPTAETILPGINDLIGAFSARGLPVIFTRHVNSPRDAGLMAVWWRDVIAADDPLSDIVSDLDTSAGEVIHKSQYDAFYRTALEDRLRGKAISQIVVCGVMTHLCCETTARSGFVRGFEVFFVVDGTATYHERFHRATVLNLSHGFAVPVLVTEILAALKDPA